VEPYLLLFGAVGSADISRNFLVYVISIHQTTQDTTAVQYHKNKYDTDTYFIDGGYLIPYYGY
jgi:hypothetical protein